MAKQDFRLYFQFGWFLLLISLVHFFESLHQLAVTLAGIPGDILLYTQRFGDVLLVYLEGNKYPSLGKWLQENQ